MAQAVKALILCLVLTGCASQRFFSDEEDAQAREACQEAGCLIVPVPIMEKLLNRLNGVRT